MNRTPIRLCTFIAIGAILLSSLLISPSDAEAGWSPDVNECAFLKEINAYRKSYGVAPLTFSLTLGMAAAHHSNYMARTDDIDHTLGSVTWSQNILNYGYPEGHAMGENILAGRRSAGGALILWESSYSHNRNMLNSTWKAIGIGRTVNLDGDYDYYWTTTFGSVSDRTISC